MPRLALTTLRILFVCLGTMLASCQEGFHREISSLVLATEGEVAATDHGQPVGLTKGAWLAPGTTVTTSAGSHADLRLLPGILVQLTGDTELEIAGLHLARDGNEMIHPMKTRRVDLRLKRGTLFVVVSRAQTRSRIQIETGAGTVSAGGDRTFMMTAEAGALRLASLRSKLSFQPRQGAAIKVHAGYFLDYPADPAPHLAATAGARAQQQIAHTLAVERGLLRLAQADPPRFLPWRERVN